MHNYTPNKNQQLYTTLILNSVLYILNKFVRIFTQYTILIYFVKHVKHCMFEACTARKDSTREVYTSITFTATYNTKLYND